MVEMRSRIQQNNRRDGHWWQLQARLKPQQDNNATHCLFGTKHLRHVASVQSATLAPGKACRHGVYCLLSSPSHSDILPFAMSTSAESETDPATRKYRMALPHCAQNISPALAALHVTRARLIDNPKAVSHQFDATHCAACGMYLLDGTSTVRVVRSGRRRKTSRMPEAGAMTRVVRRTCSACGRENDLRIEQDNAQMYPRVAKRKGASDRAVAGISAAEPPEDVPTKTVRVSTTTDIVQAPPMSSTSKPTKTPSKVISTSRVDETPNAKSNPRPKKKTGLQEMLARSRERQAKERSASAGPGLASFLLGL